MRKLWILASVAVLYALPPSAQAQLIGTDGIYNMNRTTGNTFNSIVGVGNAALVVSGDDVAFTFNFVAPFSFYGTPSTSASVSTNGLITFGGTANTTFTNSALTATNPTAPSLAPYWDDLLSTSPQGVYVQTAGNTTTVEWQTGYFSGGGTAAFQVAFDSSNGSMTMNYGDLSTGTGNANGASATVGIKGISTFIQAGFNTAGTVTLGDRLLITQAVPEPTSLALVGIAGVGLVWRRLRRKA